MAFRKKEGAREDTWEAVARATGGTVLRDDNHWFGDGPRVEAPVPFDQGGGSGAWTVVLDQQIVVVPAGKVFIPITYIRARAVFQSRPGAEDDGLRLTVFRANLFSGIAALFGMQDVEVGGDPAFDKAFVVRGNDAEAARLLLGGAGGERLRSLLSAVPEPHLSVLDDGHSVWEGGSGKRLPSGVDLLYTYHMAAHTPDDAIALYELTAETLCGLARIGAALPAEVDVRL